MAAKESSKKNTASKNNGEVAPEPARLPLFYSSPEVLEPNTHAGLELSTEISFAFAGEANSIPLNGAEFPIAARSYPIVFIGNDNLLPVAIVGLRNRQNLFVDAEGKWQRDAYVPAYVRRYPFIFVRDDDAVRYALCIDRASPRIVEGDRNPFFEGQELSEMTKKALEFCTTYQQQVAATEKALAVLSEADLIVPNQGTFTLPSGESLSLTDFKVIDEKKLNALADADFVKLRKSGALAMAYCQLISMSAWPSLVRAVDARK